MPADGEVRATEARLPAWLRVAAVIAIVAPLLAPTGSPGLINPDEGRFTEIAREMVATGDWVVPRLNGVPHWSKPPLAYWAIGVSLELFGMTERAARLPSALAASAALLATWFLARRMGGARVAAISVIVLASMIQFHLLGRSVSTDMILCGCVTWTAALLWHGRADRAGRPASGGSLPGASALRPGLPWATYLAFVCLGISFGAKGPVGLGVTLSALALFWILRPTTRLVSLGQLAIGLAIVLLIGLPWFLIVVRLRPELVEFYLGREVRDRYLTEIHGRVQGPWFFPLVLTIATLPWTLAVFLALWRAGRSLWRRAHASLEDANADRFLLAWTAGPFIMFSFSGSKLPTYLLPIFPACAIAAARHLAAVAGAAPLARLPRILVVLAATAGIFPAGAIAVAVLAFSAPGRLWILAGAAALASVILLRWLSTPAGARASLAALAAIAAITLAWMWSLPVIVDEADMDLHSHASQRWLRAVAAREHVRGAPIGQAVRPDPAARLDSTTATIAIWRLKVNSLPFYLLGKRPEYVPLFGYAVGWELKSDEHEAHVPELPELVALLRRPERFLVLSRRDALGEVEAAFGGSLAVLGAYGRGDHAIVLAANR